MSNYTFITLLILFITLPKMSIPHIHLANFYLSPEIQIKCNHFFGTFPDFLLQQVSPTMLYSDTSFKV